MAMRFRIFRNMIEQGFEGMWRNRGMGLASVGSISAVLLILGIVLILILSINNVAIKTKEKFDEIKVHLDDDIRPDELAELESKMRSDDRVVSYKFESDEEALDILRKDLEEDSYILDGLEEDNPLPNSFIIKIGDIEDAEGLVEDFSELAGVEDIPYYKDAVDKLMDIAYYIRIGGIIVIGILILVSIFIISNTVKITVTSREREVNIMKYVGATNGYIRGPFIIEGILFGLLAAIISIGLIRLGYDYFFKMVNDSLYYFSSVYLIQPTTIFKDISIMFIAIGSGIGALGSIVSLRRFLKV